MLHTKSYAVLGTLVGIALLLVLLPSFGGCTKPAQTPSPTKPTTAAPAPKVAPSPSPTPSAVPKPAPTTAAPTPKTTAPAPAPAKPISLKLAGWYPAGHPLEAEWEIWFMKRIEERTQGRIKWEHYPNQQLVKGTEMLEATGKGICDLGQAVFSYYGGKLPLFEAEDLPFLTESLPKKIDILGKLLTQPDVVKYWVQFNVQPSWYYSTDWQVIMSKKPIRTLEEFKGTKIRVGGGVFTDTMQALGGYPIAMASAESYLALQRGTIDAIFHYPSSAWGWKYQEVTKYTVITTPPISSSTGLFIWNRDKWNSLPKDIQDIITEVQNEQTKKQVAGSEGRFKEYLDQLKGAGQEIIYITPQETARWKEKLAPVKANWAKDKGDAAQRVLSFVLEMAGEKPTSK